MLSHFCESFTSESEIDKDRADHAEEDAEDQMLQIKYGK
jgi:hypothetical protein